MGKLNTTFAVKLNAHCLLLSSANTTSNVNAGESHQLLPLYVSKCD